MSNFNITPLNKYTSTKKQNASQATHHKKSIAFCGNSGAKNTSLPKEIKQFWKKLNLQGKSKRALNFITNNIASLLLIGSGLSIYINYIKELANLEEKTDNFYGKNIKDTNSLKEILSEVKQKQTIQIENVTLPNLMFVFSNFFNNDISKRIKFLEGNCHLQLAKNCGSNEKEVHLKKALSAYEKIKIKNSSWKHSLGLDNLRNNESKFSKAEYFNNKGNAYWLLSKIRNREENLLEAIDSYKSSIEEQKKNFPEINKVDKYTNFDKKIQYLSKTRKNKKDKKNFDLELFRYSRAKNNLGNVLGMLSRLRLNNVGKLNSAQKNYHDSIDICLMLFYWNEIANSQNNKYPNDKKSIEDLLTSHKKLNIGLINPDSGENLKNFEFIEKCINKRNYYHGYAESKNNLGCIYNEYTRPINKNQNKQEKIKFLHKAEDCFNKSLSIYGAEDTPFEYGKIKSSLSKIYYQIAKNIDNNPKERENFYHKARLAAEESLSIFAEKVKDTDKAFYPSETADSNNDLGIISILKDEDNTSLQIAEDKFKESNKVIKKNENCQAYSKIMNNYAIALSKKQDENSIRKSIEIFERCKSIYPKPKYPIGFIINQNNLGNAYSRLYAYGKKNPDKISTQELKSVYDKAKQSYNDGINFYSKRDFYEKEHLDDYEKKYNFEVLKNSLSPFNINKKNQEKASTNNDEDKNIIIQPFKKFIPNLHNEQELNPTGKNLLHNNLNKLNLVNSSSENYPPEDIFRPCMTSYDEWYL